MAPDQLLSANREEICVFARNTALATCEYLARSRGERQGPIATWTFWWKLGRITPWFPGGLLMDLQDLLGRHLAIVEPGALHWYIRDRVLEEAVAL